MAGKYSSILVGKEQKPLSYTQLKTYIMTERGISTTADYQKYYDIMRNRVRNYERLTNTKIGNVTEWLYKLAKDEAYDRDSGIVRQARIVEQATSASTGSSIEGFRETFDKRIDPIVERDFAMLIERDPKSVALRDTLKGEALLEALRDRAQEIADFKAANPRDKSNGIATDDAYDYGSI